MTNLQRLAAITDEVLGSQLARQPWEPSHEEIAGRLVDHLEYCGRASMPPLDIAKDCRFLLERSVAPLPLSDEVIDSMARGAEKMLATTNSATAWLPILRGLIKGAYRRGIEVGKP